MTTATTGDKSRSRSRSRSNRQKRKPVPWLWIILGVSVGAHVVGWFALRPFGQRTMVFDVTEEQERSQEVRQRELEREKRERERRAALPLTQEQSEALKAEAEKRENQEIADRVREMTEVRKALELIREATFDALKSRAFDDVVAIKKTKLDRALERMHRELEQFARTKDGGTGENEKVKAQAEAIQATSQALDASIGETRAQTVATDREKIAAADLQRELTSLVQNLTDAPKQADAGNNHRRHLRHETMKFANEARGLLDDLLTGDMNALNDTSTAEARELSSEQEDAQAQAQAQAQARAQAQAQADSESQSGANDTGEQSAAEAYENAVALEQELQNANNDIRAAELAMSQNIGFEQAQEVVSSQSPERPDLGARLGAKPKTVGELNALREALSEASGEAKAMSVRGQAMLNQAASVAGRNGTPPSGERGLSRFARQALMNRAALSGQRVSSMPSRGGEGRGGEGDSRGGGDSGGGTQADTSGETGLSRLNKPKPKSIKLERNQVLAKSLPGRMFTESSERAGWLYLDTWYVIGPWENEGNLDFDRVHPPEFEIDFDAAYTDGKFGDAKDHPYQTLRWQFVQADHIRVEPPKVYGSSTYYAFTEVYFDSDREMLISIASDDAAKLWVNGDVVWTDFGLSAWKLGEGFRWVKMKKGFNTILARVENGPARCVFSVLLCPPEAAGQ